MTHLSIAKFISTIGFIGYLPFAPGTYGTLAAAVLIILLKPSFPVHIVLTIFFIVIGIFSSDYMVKNIKKEDETHTSLRLTKGNENVIPAKAGIQKAKSLDSRLRTAGMTLREVFLYEKSLKKKDDPGYIVIDEFAGYMVSLLFLPLTWGYLIGAFILFRIFDIIKPPPIRRIEKSLKGGTGIMTDDVMAGIYTNMVLQVWKTLNI